MKNAFVVFGLVVSFVFLNCKGQSKSVINNVSAEEMQTLLKIDSVQLVDVRTLKEFKAGFIANAQNIDFYSPTFDEDIKKLDKKKPVILYCHSGRRSASCAEKMKKAGFEKIYNLQGGILEWKQEGLKVVKE